MQYQRCFIIITAFVLSTIMLVSCQKPNDTPPDFTIDKPLENSQWSVYDSIPFTITFKNIKAIKQIQVGIINSSMIPATTSDMFDLEQFATGLSGFHHINKPDLSSGVYYFKVTAYDYDGNSTSRYTRIYISEIPLRSIALYVVAKQNNSTMNIFRVDSVPEYTNVLTLSTDYSGSAISSSSSHFYICGRYTGPLAAYDINQGHQISWQENPILNPPFPYFEAMTFDGQNVVAGYNDNRVKGFHPNGTLSYVFEIDELWPRVFLRHYDHQQQKYLFIVGCTHYTGMAHTISVHYDVSYSNMQFLLTDWEMTKMFSKNYDEIYMFGNEGNQAVMKIYKISENNTYVLKTFPPGKLYDVVRVRQNIFLISHDQGLFMYNYDYNSLTPYGSFDGQGCLEYDAVTDKCFYGRNNSIEIFDFLSGSIEGNINLADSIVKLHILYNKNYEF